MQTTTLYTYSATKSTTATYITSFALSRLISRPTMDALPFSTAHDACDTARHPPLGPLDDNKLLSTATKLKPKKTLP